MSRLSLGPSNYKDVSSSFNIQLPYMFKKVYVYLVFILPLEEGGWKQAGRGMVYIEEYKWNTKLSDTMMD